MLEKVPTPEWKNTTDYTALSWISTFYVQLCSNACWKEFRRRWKMFRRVAGGIDGSVCFACNRCSNACWKKFRRPAGKLQRISGHFHGSVRFACNQCFNASQGIPDGPPKSSNGLLEPALDWYVSQAVRVPTPHREAPTAQTKV